MIYRVLNPVDKMSGPTVDFGAHYHPTNPEPFEPYHDFIDEADGTPICSDSAAVLKRYNETGIDYAVLSQPYYMGHGDTDRVAGANDELLELIEENESLLGLAAIPTAAGGDAAASEFRRCLDNGYNGGAVETTSDGIDLLDEELQPVFEVANETGAPILVHPKLHDSLGEGVLDDTWRLNAIFGREVALASTICKLIHEGIYDEYPNLSLVFHHSGGNIASMVSRIRLQLDEGRWPGLDDLKSYREFESQLTSRVYIDSSGYFGDRAPFSSALDVFPASNVLLGTDFPYETRAAETFDRFIESFESECSDSDVEKILGRNAFDLLINTE